METPRRTRRGRSKAPTRCAACLANPHNRKFVTMWNTVTHRKIAGTAAPCPDELQEYLVRHPHVQVYRDQDGGPDAVKQRRRDRNREKERRKREEKRVAIENGNQNNDSRIVTREAGCFDNGSMVNGQSAQTADDRLGHDLGFAKEEKRVSKVKEEPKEEVTNYCLETGKLRDAENSMTEKKALESEERKAGGVHPEDVFTRGHKLESTHPPAPIARLIEKGEKRKPQREEPVPGLGDDQECQFAAQFPEYNRPYILPNEILSTERASTQKNARTRKRKTPFFLPPDLSDSIFTQRVWAAEAYAAIAERRRKRKREAAMEEEDEEIREFRDLLRRIS